MMRVFFSQIACRELDDASRFYEIEFPGLGLIFLAEVRQTIKRVAEYPLAWPVETGDVRRCLLHKFPYKLLYAIESDHVVILAVAHQHRKPDYWHDE